MDNIYKYIGRQTPAVLYCEKEFGLTPGECYGPIIRNIFIIDKSPVIYKEKSDVCI